MFSYCIEGQFVLLCREFDIAVGFISIFRRGALVHCEGERRFS
jgi:hypothetical protein